MSDNNNNGNGKDKDKKDNVIKFPNTNENNNEVLDDLLGLIFRNLPEGGVIREDSRENDEKLEIKQPDPNQSIKEVIANLTNEEVYRIQKNLYFLDFLEDELRTQVQERAQSNTLDLKTLQEVIATMNKSVGRSGKLLRDKDSDLVQIMIDARTQNIENQVNVSEQSENIIGKKSRKKLQKLLGALISEADKDEDEDIIDVDYNISEDEDESDWLISYRK